MSMYGAHIETFGITGERTDTQVMSYSTWAGCFAGLSSGAPAQFHDDHTAIEHIALSALQGRLRDIQTKFLFGEFCQRLTDSAFVASYTRGANWDNPRKYAYELSWGQVLADRSVSQRAHFASFIPHRHQDLIVTALRISAWPAKVGLHEFEHIPVEDDEYIPLAMVLRSCEGQAYSDSGIVLTTPKKKNAVAYCDEHRDGDWSEMYDDDMDNFDGEPWTYLTRDGVVDMLGRTTEEFRGLCRKGLPDIIQGYTKDCELSQEELDGLDDDDPIGLAAPLRMLKTGGPNLCDMSLQEVIKLIKDTTRG